MTRTADVKHLRAILRMLFDRSGYLLDLLKFFLGDLSHNSDDIVLVSLTIATMDLLPPCASRLMIIVYNSPLEMGVLSMLKYGSRFSGNNSRSSAWDN